MSKFSIMVALNQCYAGGERAKSSFIILRHNVSWLESITFKIPLMGLKKEEHSLDLLDFKEHR